MAEMMAFNRRHAPRQSDSNVENRRHSLTPAGHAAAVSAAHSGGDPRANATVVMASHSKKRRDKPAASSSPGATTGAAAKERKMSGAQLRLFFLLCVAVYFSVICFADDIVRFAKWMSDEDPVVAWQAPSTTPQNGGTTPKPAQPPGAKDRKRTAVLVVVKGATQTEKPREKTGNLRGGEAAKTGERIKEETEETNVPDTKEKVTPEPEPTQVEEKVTPEPEPTQVEEEATLAPQPSPVDEEEKEKEKENVEVAVAAPETTAAVRSDPEELGDELPRETLAMKLALNADDDAPLESADEGGHRVRGETTTEPEPTTEAAAVPAQIPDLGLVSEPTTEPQLKEEHDAQGDFTTTDDATQLRETPQLIQAT